MSYQLMIESKAVSRPMVRREAEALEGLLQVIFPGLIVLAIPLLCPDCGNPLPEAGPCWHNSFEEEETVISPEELEAEIVARGESIPFDGRAMPNKETDTKSYYGL